jgi:hypothetical protein
VRSLISFPLNSLTAIRLRAAESVTRYHTTRAAPELRDSVTWGQGQGGEGVGVGGGGGAQAPGRQQNSGEAGEICSGNDSCGDRCAGHVERSVC